jgi:hypothetical protein
MANITEIERPSMVTAVTAPSLIIKHACNSIMWFIFEQQRKNKQLGKCGKNSHMYTVVKGLMQRFSFLLFNAHT